MNKGECSVCSYWQKTVDRSEDQMQDEGICRRHAPAAVPMEDEDYSETGWLAKWPRTCAESDWCGDFVVRTDLQGREKVQCGCKVIGMDWKLPGLECPNCKGGGRIGAMACANCGATGRINQ